MSEGVIEFSGEWTPEAMEKIRALIVVKDPKWYRPLMWALLHLPGTKELRRDIDRYQLDRAVRIYRSRK